MLLTLFDSYMTLLVSYRIFTMPENTATTALFDLLFRLGGAYAPNTLRAYKADMSEFIRYASESNSSALPATPITVAQFLQHTNNGSLKSSTIRRKAASISAIHRLSSYVDPTKSLEVHLALRKIYRQLGNRHDQAYPITRSLLDKLLDVCANDLRGKRNRALLLLAYDSMRRRAELVSLRVEDMEFLSEDGASILLRRSKTDQVGTGQWIHMSNETTMAVEEWLKDAGIQEGFVFRGIDTRGHVTGSLCESRVGRIYKRLAKLAKLDEKVVQRISGHSMRVGGAQDLLHQGASLPQIMVKGGWAKSDTVMRYVERVNRPTPAKQQLAT
jgi:site-specific recombinase XerD